MTNRNKLYIWGGIGLVAVVLAALTAYRLWTTGADGVRASAVLVERIERNEICVDGRAVLYFDHAEGDSVLVGITTNADSATHRHLATACWADRWLLLPSCQGRLLTVMPAETRLPEAASIKVVIDNTCSAMRSKLKMVDAQLTELHYYMRVHGVQDDGYQQIAALTEHVSKVRTELLHTKSILDSIAAGKHKLSLHRSIVYNAVCRNANGRASRIALNMVSANAQSRCMLLRTADGQTPEGAQAVSLLPWAQKAETDIVAAGIPSIGEQGIWCDTVSVRIIPGHKQQGGRHNLPRVLASDGSPVFTAHGRFIGIVSGNSIVGRESLRQLLND